MHLKYDTHYFTNQCMGVYESHEEFGGRKKNAHCIYLTQFKVGCFYKFRISYSYKISWRTYENKLKIF